MPRLIVTADDLGMSHEVNTAILEALQRDLVTHASLMANMEAFDEACELAREGGVLDRLGVHLVLTEGVPLTESVRSCQRVCDEKGRFRYWRNTDHAFHLSRTEREAVSTELRAQVNRCRDRGVHPTHLDSHHHVHNKLALSRIVIALARELGVPRVRLAHNCGPRIGIANRAFKEWVNLGLRRAELAQTRWFGSADDYFTLRAAKPTSARLDSFEFNTHPTFRNGLLIDLDHPDSPLELFLSPANIRSG